MFDIYGNQYLSISHLVQAPDSLPPATPTGLAGSIDANGHIQLSWDANSEDDLDGYRVYYKFGRNLEYIALTDGKIQDTLLHTAISSKVSTDSVFISVTALDYRYNESPHSPLLALDRPANIAQGKAIITIINPIEQGVRIGWITGEKPGITYTLQRKRYKSNENDVDLVSWDERRDWQAIEEEFGEQQQIFFIDSSELIIAKYRYRIKCVDENGLISYSNSKIIYPYDDGIRGFIDDPIAHGERCDLEQNTVGGSPGGTSGGTGGSGTSGGGTGTGSGGSSGNNAGIAMPCTLLKWNYSTDYHNSLTSFKIYRKDEGQPLSPGQPPAYVLVKTIYKQAAQAEAALYGNGYEYAYLNENGTKPGAAPIVYKILAEHRDGGTSEWSEEVVVQ